MVSITTVATWLIWTGDFWADFEQSYHWQSNKRVAKRLWASLNAERQHSNTCCNFWYLKIFYYSNRNSVCVKDSTLLFIRQHKLEWRAVKDCYSNSFQLVLCYKHNCFLTLWFNYEYWILLKLKNFWWELCQDIVGSGFLRHRKSNHYHCYGNSAAGSQPI